MQLHHVVFLAFVLHRDANAQLASAITARKLDLVAIALADHHVAAVARATLQISARGGVLFDRRDHLDEVVTDRHQGVLESEYLDARIDVTNLESKDGLEILDHRSK